MAEGQIEGGLHMGMGFACSEEYIWRDGVLQNDSFTDYKIPLSVDAPQVHSIWVEHPNPGSPYGAKPLGEPSLNPVAAAIANAIYDAVGVRIKDLPMKPVKIRRALREEQGKIKQTSFNKDYKNAI